jgi:PHS family inorganic phosphate transporter-like MFS transporter
MPQLEVLTALDTAKTQWYHFTAIIIAGMGFFTDAYDLFSIPVVTGLLGRLYYQKPGAKAPGTLPVNVNAAVSAVALCGTLAGQLFFGWLGDKLGRKKVYGMTLMLMVIAALACGLSFGHTANSVMTTLCFFRFWLGFGIGGDYPLSATIMSEYANTRTRGAFIAAVFAMQGTGILVAAAVGCVVSAIYNHAVHAPPFSVNPQGSVPDSSDFVWRVILMFGAIPALATYYYRMKMPETARYTALVAGDAKQAAEDMAKVLQVEQIQAVERKKDERIRYGLFSPEFMRRHGRHLLGTTTCWFLLDVAFYSQNLFQKNVYVAVGWIPSAPSMSAVEEVFRISRAQALIALCSTVPGYWFTVFLIDRIGRFKIQLQGFFFMTVFMLGLTIPYNHWLHHNHAGFLVMYALTFFFSNFGPNSTTFIVPAELFPARFRSTCHGISAASGKAGAIVGSFGFLYASQPSHQSEVPTGYKKGIGIRGALFIMAGVNAMGFLCTFLVPETNQISLEDLSGENEDSNADNEVYKQSTADGDGVNYK